MQHHVRQDDLTNPSGFAHPLSAEPGVLRQACHHVGIPLDPRRPWDIPALPVPLLTLGFLPKALASVGLVPGQKATYLTDLKSSGKQQRWEMASWMAHRGPGQHPGWSLPSAH